MENIEYLFAGFAVFWAALFIYLLTLQARIRSLQKEIGQLEERLADAEGAPRAAARDTAPGAATSPQANS